MEEVNDFDNEICLNSQADSTSIAPYASVAFSTLGGFVIGRVPGALLGFAVAFEDELLAAKDISDKHYLTRTAYWHATYQPYALILSNAFPAYKLPISIATYTLSAIISYLTNDFISFKEKIDVSVDSFLTINKFFDKKEIFSKKELQNIVTTFKNNSSEGINLVIEDAKEIYNNPFIYNFIAGNTFSITQLLISTKITQYLGQYAGNVFISTLIQDKFDSLKTLSGLIYNQKSLESIKDILVSSPIAREYTTEAMNIIGIYTASLAINSAIDEVQNYLAEENDNIVIDKATETLFSNGNGKYILSASKKEGQEIINHSIEDLWFLKEGANKLNSVTTTTSAALIAQNNLIKFAPDAILPYIFSLFAKQYFLHSLIGKSKSIAEEREAASLSANNILTDIMDNLKKISLRDAEKYMAKKFNEEWKKLKKLDADSRKIRTQKTLVDAGIVTHNKVVDVIYFGAKILVGKFDIINNIQLIGSAVDTIYKYLSSNLDAQEDNIKYNIAMTRINRMFELIKLPINHAARIDNEDGRIIFKNYSLRLNNQEMIKIDDLVFEQGKHYAITGDSGCGKSSTLIDLKEGVVGALNSRGEISLPSGAKIMFLNQGLYLPKESSLLESIYFPNIIDDLTEEEQLIAREKIIALLTEVNIDAFVGNTAPTESLFNKLDIQEFELSGGQLQKIGAIQAILNQPDVLIMDENLTGLDENSLIAIQKVLNKYLPHATIIVIDHKAQDNNYDGFYDYKINFTTYSYKLLQSAEGSLKNSEIGLFLEEGKLFCKHNDREDNLEIREDNENGISHLLYNKIISAIKSSSKFTKLKLETEEKQQLMKFTSAEGYTIKTAWVEESGIASKSLDNNDLVLKDLLLDIMDGKELDSASLNKLHTLINEKNAENAPVAIEPEEFTWGLYVGECPNGEILA